MTPSALLRLLDDELPDAIRLRHRLHAIPEPGGAEARTCAVIAEHLPQRHRVVAGTGMIVRVGAGGEPAIGVRAELDGLPMTERTGAAYASDNGHMHACGHDVHLAALVALVRAARRTALPAPLVAIFQPCEERHPSGAVALLRDGELEAEAVESVVAVHVHPDLPWGAIGADPGTVNAAADAIRIDVEGRGGHAAYPHRTRDPVLALSQLVVALHGLVGRRVDPVHGATLTVGAVHAGTAENVIPGAGHALVTVRALDAADQRELRAAVRECAEHVAAAHGCTARLTFTKSEPPLVNDPALAEAARRRAAAAGFALAPAWHSCGGDDFAHYGTARPTLMAFVGLGGAPGFTHAGLHDPRFLPPDEAVAACARAQALAYAAALSVRSGTPAGGTSAWSRPASP
ncbi:M20 family metallopeptidase [Nonomuraea sp. NPDC049152]|uniref:M20 metallopeptidase family protein n=1 Tax=Nonomuraea sp. NPDC049152 TaxID=3154350 RepID=UPI0033D3D3B0